MGVRQWVRTFAVGILALTALPSAAQDAEEDENCPWSERAQPACIEARAAQSAEAYGLLPLETYGDADTAELRVFFIDAWGREKRAIVLSRPAGQSPRLEMRFAYDLPITLSQQVSGDLWDRFHEDVGLLPRRLAPPPPREDGSIVICADGTTAILELRPQNGPVRRAIGHSCANGVGSSGYLTFALAERVERLAADNLVHCADLNRDYYRFVSLFLEMCSTLEGDIPSASNALDLFMRHGLDNRATAVPQRVLARNAVLVLHDGTMIEGGEAIAEYWLANFNDILLFSVTGESALTARMAANIDLKDSWPREGADMWIEEAVFVFSSSSAQHLPLVRIELGEPVALPEPDELD